MKLTPPPITPGPWYLEHEFDYEPSYVVAKGSEIEVCQVPPVGEGVPPNARAIAALPKVLEALAKNHAFYQEMRAGGYCIDCDHEHDVTLQALLEVGYMINEP